MANLIAPTGMPTGTYPSNRGVIAFLPADVHTSQPTKRIEGFVRNTAGDLVAGATVVLFRQADNTAVRTTTTDGGGKYVFLRDVRDTNAYFTIGFTLVNGTTQIHGTSNRGLVAV